MQETRLDPILLYYRDVLQLRADLPRILFLMCLAVLLLFVITVNVDRAAALGAVTLQGWFSIGGADDARAIQGAVLGAVSTALALIFSVALLVLSMAASQFGPRILHRFKKHQKKRLWSNCEPILNFN